MEQVPSGVPALLPAEPQSSAGELQAVDRAGKRLGNYRLLRLLASGGFAEVYLAEHRHLHTRAAIKILHAPLAREALAEFRREARIVARLRHPHIISVLDFAVHDDTAFLVMDYAPNGTLRQRHPRGTRLEPVTILTYLRQIGEALDYAHSAGFIHCDIKPENMLIGRRGEILLSDFGLAITGSRRQLASVREVPGTLSYMAPEQLDGSPQAASDQYALGVVVYEWLCGECPFRGLPAEVLAQHINTHPPSLCARVPGLSRGLEQAVLRALAKNPEERYASVLDFVTAFERALYAQMEHRRVRYSRRTLVLSLGGLAAAGLCGGGIAWLAHAHESSARASAPHAPSQSEGKADIGSTRLVYHGQARAVQALLWLPPSGACIVSGGLDASVQVWNADTGLTLVNYGEQSGGVNAVSCSADGARIASAGSDAVVRVWRASDGHDLYSYHGHTADVLTVAWSPDGARIASAGLDGSVQVWDALSASPLYTYLNHEGAVNAVAWSPDGLRIASAGADSSVQVWNATAGDVELIYRLHSGSINAVAWSPDGSRIVSVGADGSVQIWESATGKRLVAWRGLGAQKAVAWAPDSAHIAAGGADHLVRIWEARSAKEPFVYREHSGAVNALAWSPNGAFIASAGADRTVRIWRAVRDAARKT